MKKRGLEKIRKLFYPASFAVVIALIFLVSGTPAMLKTAVPAKELPIYRVQREDKAVSLTFDAAWGNEITETLINILAQYDIKATFFVIGEWVDKYPESVKALHDAGHEVMTHSDDHAHFKQLTSQQIIENIDAGCDKIEALTGVRPTLFRCPYGEYDDHVIKTVAEMGLKTIQWDVDSMDWKDLSAGEITRRVQEKAKPGSIVLFHNAGKHTPEALPGIIEFLLQNDFSIVPVSELLLTGDYVMDRTGKMCKPGAA